MATIITYINHLMGTTYTPEKLEDPNMAAGLLRSIQNGPAPQSQEEMDEVEQILHDHVLGDHASEGLLELMKSQNHWLAVGLAWRMDILEDSLEDENLRLRAISIFDQIPEQGQKQFLGKLVQMAGDTDKFMRSIALIQTLGTLPFSCGRPRH